jgi:RNA polymerase sigma-70 factor (ECF subfamily)
VNLRDDLNSSAPQLRRYARALASGHPGPNEIADDLVHAALRRTLDQAAPGRRGDIAIHLYSLITEMHREALRAARFGASAAVEKGSSYAGGARAAGHAPSLCPPRDKLSGALAGLKLEEREALLLVVLEGLNYAQAARVLKISQPILLARLARARDALGGSLTIETPPIKHRPRPSHLRLIK